jgi:MFS family permease
MSILTVYDMVPKEKLALYGALISITIALATLTGPIFGGLLVKASEWRWVFYVKCLFHPSQYSVRP